MTENWKGCVQRWWPQAHFKRHAIWVWILALQFASCVTEGMVLAFFKKVLLFLYILNNLLTFILSALV